jgi:hypothetical protein
MPEPERKIEELLRATAKKRREEAGSFEMHPATRKMLQDEAARTHRAAGAPLGAEKISWFSPRFAFPLAIMAALIIVLVIVLPDSSRQQFQLSKNKEELAPISAKGVLLEEKLEEKQSGENESLRRGLQMAQSPDKDSAGESHAVALGRARSAAPTGESGLRRETGAARPERRLLRDSDTPSLAANAPQPTSDPRQKLADEAELSKAKPAPEPKPATTPAAAAPSAATRSTVVVGAEPPGVRAPAPNKNVALAEELRKVPAEKSALLQAQPAAPIAPTQTTVLALALSPAMPEPATSANYYAAISGAARLDFTKVDTRARFRRNFQSPAEPSVLNSFQIERDGNKILIRDADGSVYEGIILSGIVSQQTTLGRSVATLSSSEAKKEGAAGGAGVGGEFAAPFDFAVSGTNASIKQIVRFTGHFSAAGPAAERAGSLRESSPVPPDRAFAVDSLRLETNANRNQVAPATGVQIQGKATIGGTNEFPVTALPTAR